MWLCSQGMAIPTYHFTIKQNGDHPMKTITQRARTGEFILFEERGSITREEVTIASTASALPAGQLLGKVSETGEYVPYDPAGTDGSESAVAILYGPAPASDVARRALAVVRDTEVMGAFLTGLDASAVESLASAGITIR